MQERFLHFLWQFQNFDHQNLATTQNESIIISKIGQLNSNAGADFQNAQIQIDGVEWAGTIEIHVRSSDWYAHTHEQNRAYENVILHVVWEHDREVFRQDNTPIPTLVLKERTDKSLLKKYEQLIQNQSVIPCASQFKEVDSFRKISMLDKALMQRLEEKAILVQTIFQETNKDWEETAYQVLAKNFGFKINAEPFLRLAQNLPLKVIQKHRDQLPQIEALVFGIAGFLEEDLADDYHKNLKKEFQFLKAKYSLQNKIMGQHEWKFLRLRPANFPTVRLAQFARMIQENANLFSLFIYLESVKNLTKLLKISQSDYWQKHFVFQKEANIPVPSLGKSSIENIVINTIVPLLVAYSMERDNRSFLEKAISLLEEIPAEKNHITEIWETLGMKVKTAFDSQASIELYNSFCTQKNCLRCDIGVSIVR
jgi:Protein of unknown function (DUF2851)